MPLESQNPFAVPSDVLAQCNDEPIETPRAVQAYGVLVIVEMESGRIVQVSANTASLLAVPPEVLLNEPFVDCFRTVTGVDVATLGMDDIPTAEASGTVWFSRSSDPKPLDALYHRAGRLLLVDLEPHTPEQTGNSLNTMLRGAIAKLNQEQTSDAVREQLARCIRTLTGFDRVMVYRFDPEWHGTVVAESAAEGIASFLGMRFPATDIPPRARALYEQVMSRLIVDRDAHPAPLLPAELAGGPTDLSMSALRAVSPVHLEYLYNMGVQATLVLSLLTDHDLWGLVSCHHHSPKYLHQSTRFAAELLAGVAMARMHDLERNAQVASILSAQQQVHRAAQEVVHDSAWPDSLAGLLHNLLPTMRCDGVAVVFGNGQQTTGRGTWPGMMATRKLHRALLASGRIGTVALDTLSPLHVSENSDPDSAICGILRTPIFADGYHQVLWFRCARRLKVTWAGAPQKRLQQHNGEERLSPRLSFARWESLHEGRSDPWLEADIEVAEGIRTAVADLVAHRQRVENEQVMRRERELEAQVMRSQQLDSLGVLAGGVAHDFNNLLVGVRCNAELLQQQPGLNQDAHEAVEDIIQASRMATDLTQQLLAFAGRGQSVPVYLDLNALVASVLPLVRLPSRVVPVHFDRADGSITLEADPTRVRQIVMNLVMNAMEATQENPQGEVTVRVLRTVPGHARLQRALYSAQSDGEQTMAVIRVTDNGSGMSRETMQRLFEPFFSTKFAGRGLGMAAVLGIVRDLNGAIEVESTLGAGSRISVLLPCEPLTSRHSI